MPTLVASATHDPIAPPRHGRALAAGVPGARYVEIADASHDASHGVIIQRGEQVNTRLREHVTRAEEQRPSLTSG